MAAVSLLTALQDQRQKANSFLTHFIWPPDGVASQRWSVLIMRDVTNFPKPAIEETSD